ncbi:MAG: tetratricopeptide repeat protein, partial [Alphaproteobacteria bacterium]
MPQSDLKAVITEARAAHQSNDFEAASRAWTQALAIAPSTVIALAGRAISQERLGRTAEAREDFAAAAKAAPDNIQARNGLARITGALNGDAAALVLWQAAVEDLPDQRPLTVNLVRCLQRLGRIDAAIDACNDYLGHMPDDLTVHLLRGRLIRAFCAPETAMDVWEAVCAAFPEAIEARIEYT